MVHTCVPSQPPCSQLWNMENFPPFSFKEKGGTGEFLCAVFTFIYLLCMCVHECVLCLCTHVHATA